MAPMFSRTGLGPIRTRREIFFEGQAHQLCQTDAGNARAAQDPFSRQPADRGGQGSAGGRGDAPRAQESQAALMPFEVLLTADAVRDLEEMDAAIAGLAQFSARGAHPRELPD